jgi:hypothetical protein
VSIIGLYSNVLDSGAGVISSQNHHFPTITDDQLTFLKTELARLKPDREAHKRAVILAVHHPAVSADAKHGGSTGMSADLDACCKAAGLWPDVVLSGHAHLYQRFTRTMNGREIPYIVSGSGGYAATMPKPLKAGTTVGDSTLVVAPIVKFGYLTITTDAKTLSMSFKTADGQGVVVADSLTLDLAAGKITSKTPAAAPSTATSGAKSSSKKGSPAKKATTAKKAKKATKAKKAKKAKSRR